MFYIELFVYNKALRIPVRMHDNDGMGLFIISLLPLLFFILSIKLQGLKAMMSRMMSNIFISIVLLLLVNLPCCVCSAFPSCLRSRLIFKCKPSFPVWLTRRLPKGSVLTRLQPSPKQVENKTHVVPRSLAEIAAIKIRNLSWTKIVSMGAVTTAGLLVSVAVVAFRRRQLDMFELAGIKTDMLSIDSFATLETILNTTSFAFTVPVHANENESTSVLLIFDWDAVSESKSKLRNNNLNLIATEVAAARSAGEKVKMVCAVD
jgi:hypothetical protein